MVRHFRFLVLLFVGFIGSVGTSLAQLEEEQLGVPTDIEKNFSTTQLYTILRGTHAPTEKEKGALDFAAKYYVWRMTWLEYLNNQDKMAKAIKDFDQDYTNRLLKTTPLNKEAYSFFHKKLAECFRDVFQRNFESNRVTTINAAQLLPIVARGRSEEIYKLLDGLIKDPKKHEAVKLYAIRAYREYYPIKAWSINDVSDMKGLDRSERIKTVVDYIERKWPTSSAKEENDAFGYLRREAVVTLAQVGIPAVKAEKKDLQGQTAITLMKVLAKDVLQPPPSLSEKCEAALGLCNLKTAESPNYQPQLAVYAIGHCLGDFINAYRADTENIRNRKVPPLFPYRVMAERWKQGLETLAANSKDPLAKNLLDQTKTMLANMQILQPINNQEASNFGAWLKVQKAANKILFKSNNQPEVDLGY